MTVENLTLSGIRNERDKFQSELRKLLDEFYKRTNLHIRKIEIVNIEQQRLMDARPIIVEQYALCEIEKI